MKIKLIAMVVLCSMFFIGCTKTETQNGNTSSNAAKSNTGSLSNTSSVAKTNSNTVTVSSNNTVTGNNSNTAQVSSAKTGIPECDDALAFIKPGVDKYQDAMIQSSEVKFSVLYMEFNNANARIKKKMENPPNKTPQQMTEMAKICKAEVSSLRSLMKKYGES